MGQPTCSAIWRKGHAEANPQSPDLYLWCVAGTQQNWSLFYGRRGCLRSGPGRPLISCPSVLCPALSRHTGLLTVPQTPWLPLSGCCFCFSFCLELTSPRDQHDSLRFFTPTCTAVATEGLSWNFFFTDNEFLVVTTFFVSLILILV